ncbi:uncharacterized protein LOC119191642, partial [Manduca sexta]|uniref:uncharacterized protein LOC119191642 n=1 Tax=Manduca sexta TaxID=7130 RepID=UPI00188FC6FF
MDINKCLEMLNLSPSSYRNVDVGDRTGTSKKVYSRRPWYAPPIDPAEILREQEQYNTDYGPEYNTGTEDVNDKQAEEYYVGHQDYEDPVTSRHVEVLGQLETSSANSKFEAAPTATSVSEFSIANAVNLREAVLVALGGASAALVLLIVMAGVFVARRRKNSPPRPSPPILVYPRTTSPHRVTCDKSELLQTQSPHNASTNDIPSSNICPKKSSVPSSANTTTAAEVLLGLTEEIKLLREDMGELKNQFKSLTDLLTNCNNRLDRYE